MSSGKFESIMSIDTADIKWTYNFMYYIDTGEPFYMPARRARFAVCRSEGSDSDSLTIEFSDAEGEL